MIGDTDIKFRADSSPFEIMAYVKQEGMLTKSEAIDLLDRLQEALDNGGCEDHSCNENCDNSHVENWDYEIRMCKQLLVSEIDWDEYPAAERVHELLDELYDSY